MTALAWAWLAFLAAVFVAGIALYVCVVRPVLRELDEDVSDAYGRFE